MKALLVADDDKAINNISQVLKSAGYDTIVYKWLLKALDNIEEIAPHLIVISTADYPRHWKTLAQYASNGFGDYTPQVILYTDENFNEDEQKKAEALHVRGCFGSIDVDGLDQFRDILSKADDIFSGYLTEDEQQEISIDDLVPESKEKTAEPEEEQHINDETIEEAQNIDDETIEEDTIDELTEKRDVADAASPAVPEEESLSAEKIEEIIGDEKAADRLEELSNDEKAADRLEEITGDERAADKLERINGNEEILTVEEILNEPYDESESTLLPGIEELKKLLEDNSFEKTQTNDIIEETAEEVVVGEPENTPENGENDMADEQSIEEKLAAIMNANKADAKEKAEALNLDTSENSVSFVFTNPITLAMVSGVARNYSGLTLEFTPDIPSFIMNLDAGTKISVASLKSEDKIENVQAEVMSNDSNKLYLAIKKFN